jgi:uncharacterized protein YebE (UPF0316 family)
MNLTVIVISVVLLAILFAFLRLWFAKSSQRHISSIILLECVLIVFALALAALKGDALIVIIAAAWFVQAGVLITVLKKFGEPLKAGNNK